MPPDGNRVTVVVTYAIAYAAYAAYVVAYAASVTMEAVRRAYVEVLGLCPHCLRRLRKPHRA